MICPVLISELSLISLLIYFYSYKPNKTFLMKFNNRNDESEMDEITYKVCVEKVKSLEFEFTPIEETLRDTIVSLKEKCFLNI